MASVVFKFWIIATILQVGIIYKGYAEDSAPSLKKLYCGYTLTIHGKDDNRPEGDDKSFTWHASDHQIPITRDSEWCVSMKHEDSNSETAPKSCKEVKIPRDVWGRSTESLKDLSVFFHKSSSSLHTQFWVSKPNEPRRSKVRIGNKLDLNFEYTSPSSAVRTMEMEFKIDGMIGTVELRLSCVDPKIYGHNNEDK